MHAASGPSELAHQRHEQRQSRYREERKADRAREEDGRTAIAQNQPLPEVLFEQRYEQKGKEQRSEVEPALATAKGEESTQARHAAVENAVVKAEGDAEDYN